MGYTADATSYHSNTVNITYNLALVDTTTDDLTATVRAWATNFKMYNINILNTRGRVTSNGQNLALSAWVGNQGYYGVGLYGYQDTLLAETGTQVYAKSKIVGAVDFIFGQTARAWLQEIDIETLAAGCVTASGRSSSANPSWYVITNSTVKGVDSSVSAGVNYLGRPWEEYARVVFQYTSLSNVINAAGWSTWSAGEPNTQDVTFAEYKNTGPGSYPTEGPRASFSEQLKAPIKIESVLGSGYEQAVWVDTSYLS